MSSMPEEEKQRIKRWFDEHPLRVTYHTQIGGFRVTYRKQLFMKKYFPEQD